MRLLGVTLYSYWEIRMKISVYIATSLDGFIARADGSLDWLDKANAAAPSGEDFGFQEFMASVDTLVMGRMTYEKVLSFGEWGYGTTPVVVLSSQPIEIQPEMQSTVTGSSESPQALCDRLSVEGVRHIYLDGGVTIRGFLADGLVDEITITQIPVLIGEGLPLFGPLENDVDLELLESRSFDSGFVQSKYSVQRSR
jgi:dihydrofolate reductase